MASSVAAETNTAIIDFSDFMDMSKFSPGARFNLSSPSNPAVIPDYYVWVTDEKGSNTAGGSFTSGVWRTRDLTTVHSNYWSFASLSTNQLTLTSGVWRCSISAPAYKVGGHRARLYDTTATNVLLLGTCESTAPQDAVTTRSHIKGTFTLSAVSVLEIQHFCGSTKTNDGFGVACSLNTNELYTIAEFWRVNDT